VSGALGRCSFTPDAGVVVVTRFDCPNYRVLLLTRMLHLVLGRRIRRQLPGLISSSTHTSVRARRVLSVTVFTSMADLYQMGSVRAHVQAARVMPRFNVVTSGAVFVHGGDWRTVLFDAAGRESPLAGL
jgi:hypothetical protein